MSLLLLSMSAHAACGVVGLAPAPGSVVTIAPTFTFLTTADCVDATVQVNGMAPRSATAVGTVGAYTRWRMAPTAENWDRWTQPGRDTLDWRATATDSVGASTTRQARLELDVDMDGHTRRGGDAGDCDDNPRVYPGAAEVVDGLDTDCDGLGEYAGDLEWAGAADLYDSYEIIDGSLRIRSTSATDLSPLSCLQVVTGDLYLAGNNRLTSLDGLDALTEVGGDLTIGDGTIPAPNVALVDLSALHSLVTVGGDLTIIDEPPDCTGLDALTSVGGTLKPVTRSTATAGRRPTRAWTR